nr:MAG TPA: hypothetical protein [Caudoviricetes sp.]
MTNEMRDRKALTLAESYRSCVKDGETANFAEWVKLTSESDSNFWHWLFDDDSPELDSSAGDHLDEWEEFLKWCETCDPFEM